jgi:pimeloyl-ACP methyl ester carboxylesterase
MQEIIPIATGAELRLTGPSGVAAVVCINGGQSGEVAGTWSATLEWLVGRLSPRFPELAFGEVRYRVKSWRHLDWCVADTRAAIAAMDPPRTLLLGFSMGGAVAVGAADEPTVETVLGLAPWIPERLPLTTLRHRRLAVLHGSLDRYLPGIPGVSPTNSRRGFERAQALGIDGAYTLIRGGIHGVAVRMPWGEPAPLPRAGLWERLVAAELERFAAPGKDRLCPLRLKTRSKSP